jgi:tRNA threonylcarbamoyladenosine biosynthesis protein TsaE
VPGDIFALDGDLGTGKTEFVRGFVSAIAAAPAVRSPTFTLCNIYETSRFPVYHFDFYRLADAAELGEIGFDEYATGGGVCLIEWGTMFIQSLPTGAKVIRFCDIGEGRREIDIPFTFK